MTTIMCAVLFAAGCASTHSSRVAVIPQTEGLSIWDSVHVGAEVAARQDSLSIYWNAPTREDDIEGQISLVERVLEHRYQGLVLAPDQSLALISPVRRVLAEGIPTAIIGSPLPLPPDPNLINIVNDDEQAGRLAAQRVASLLDGRGTVAILGMNPDVTGILTRAHVFEKEIAIRSPGIKIVERHAGSFNVPHEQQVAEDTLRRFPHLDIVVALTWTTADGALRALEATGGGHPARVVAFDSTSLPPFDQWPRLDSVIQEDTRTMGQKAVEAISARIHKHSIPSIILLPPTLITRSNVNSPEVHRMIVVDWQIGNWQWAPIQ